jgi:thioredoxin 1
MAEAYVHISDDTFEGTVLKAELPAVVDFWAPWCRPCLAMAPALEALAAEYTGKMRFTKLNVDEYQGVQSRYGVQSFPTLLFFYQGREVERLVGFVKQEELKRRIERVLAGVAV